MSCIQCEGLWQVEYHRVLWYTVHLYCTTPLSVTKRRRQCMLTRFTGDTKLGGPGGMLKGNVAIWRDLDRLEKWTNGNLRKFNRDECEAQHH